MHVVEQAEQGLVRKKKPIGGENTKSFLFLNLKMNMERYEPENRNFAEG